MTPPDTQSSRLNQQEIQQFHELGYTLPTGPVFPMPKFDALKNHFEQRLVEWSATSGMSPEHMDTPHFADPKLFDWLFADEVLDLVEPLIGPDIALWSSHFICKPAGTGKRVPWHEDSAYWGQVLDPMEVVTVWLAIDPSTPGNGACVWSPARTRTDIPSTATWLIPTSKSSRPRSIHPSWMKALPWTWSLPRIIVRSTTRNWSTAQIPTRALSVVVATRCVTCLPLSGTDLKSVASKVLIFTLHGVKIGQAIPTATRANPTRCG